MGVAISTVSRWADETPPDPFGRRPPKSWRPAWFGYPSPLPAYDRICERALGVPYLERLSADRPMGEVLGRLRESGLSIFVVVPDRAQVLELCRQIDIPDSSRLRWMETTWPSQWGQLDKLSRSVAGVGWPEFVLSYEPAGRPVELQIPGLRTLLAPLLHGLHVRPERVPTEDEG